MNTARLLLAATLAGLALAPGHAATQHDSRIPADQRRAFFGELHLHTTMSFDAWTFGTKVTPDQAYRFARGETVMVPAVQVSREQGVPARASVPARRTWPLDFTAVTDHSEFLGAMSLLDRPNSGFARTDTGHGLLSGGQDAFFRVGLIAATTGGRGWFNTLMMDALRLWYSATRRDLDAAAVEAKGWATEIKAANDNYIPGKFTTFIAYEWTAAPQGGVHMHRNVIFNSDHAPAPFTAMDSDKPEDLWTFLESVRRQGIDVLAIPHNSNLSDGRDFDWNMSNGSPIDQAYALRRAFNEPLVEIDQLKGASETTPELSPSDEFANFGIMDRIYSGEDKPVQHGSYVREAYGRGLMIRSWIGVNPFKMGIVGASDIHSGLSNSVESEYAGGNAGIDPRTMSPTGKAARAALAMDQTVLAVRPNGQRENDPLQYNSAAITGVWAEENTRSSIFAALKRKETFATSGTRIRLRMFGSWQFDPRLLASPGWIRTAYAGGVPMGGDFPVRPKGAGAPFFILEALKDPDGANLDRIQIVKIWLEGGAYRETIFDVALSGNRRDNPTTGRAPAVGNTVDLKTGVYYNTIGAAALSTVWRDPQFDPKKPAVYYARVLEIPTPRWSTLLALRNRLPIPRRVPATIQERAWSSPIWFTPAKS